MKQNRAWVSRLWSYRKRTWTLEDYPVRLFRRSRPRKDFRHGRLKIVWRAEIIKWWLAGHGDTEENALASLQPTSFYVRRNGGKADSRSFVAL